MSKLKKVIVGGWIETEFIGTEPQVLKFLSDLKSRQLAAISAEDAKFYVKDAKVVRNASDYSQLIRSYYVPSPDRDRFRDRNCQFGLKIKIEDYVINEYF